jgi:hypothetical protein
VVGEITGEGAARRYIEAGHEMGLIVPIGREWQNTKAGHVLIALRRGQNIFKLSLAQRFMFFHILLERDYLYLKTLFELLADEPGLDDIERFQQKVTSSIDGFVKRSKKTSEVVKLREAEKEIRGWTDPSYYRDHIRATRLEWLLDLGILTKWNQHVNYLTFRPNTKDFFSSSDIQTKWLAEKYAETFYTCFQDAFSMKVIHWRNVRNPKRKALLTEYLEDATAIFRPNAQIDKISAWQFLNYASCLLLTEKGIIASQVELESALAAVAARFSGYRYVKMTSDVDIGYIVRERA